MADGEKTFEEIKKESGLEEVSDPEASEAKAEESEEASDSFSKDIEEEFPQGEMSNLDRLLAEAENGTGEDDSSAQGLWIDFKKMDFKKDALNLFKKPFNVIIFVLGILVLVLFLAMFMQYRADEYSKELEGYVRTNFKAPEWHHGELPDDLKEVIKIYEDKKRKEAQARLLIQNDPRAKEPIIGRDYPNPINNKTLKAILRRQNIGEVTEEGVVKTELMNLSGLDMSKLNYKYFRNMIASNLRYASFSGIEVDGLLFRGASMQYSQFVDAVIPSTNFVRAKLSFSNFYQAIADSSLFNYVTAEKAHFNSARMVSAKFDNAIFLRSDFSNSVLDGVSAKYSDWEGTNFSESSLVGVNFKSANLKGASFVAADLTHVNFEGANLEGANFEGANLAGANFKDADVTQVVFKDVINASFNQLNKAKFLLSAYSLPEELVPKKNSWKERFTVPHDDKH